MKVLFVSRTWADMPKTFVIEQADALAKYCNIEIQHFLIKKGGIKGYFKAAAELSDLIKSQRIDIVHAHYGLSAFAVVISKLFFYKKYKMVTTFHGSDILLRSELKFSMVAARFSAHNILVSEKMLPYFHKKYSLIPCGINVNINLCLRDKIRDKMNWVENDFVVLFSSGFDRKIKDPEFAFEVIRKLSDTLNKQIKFIELKGYSRTDLTGIMQAADALLMCSKSEGSPQIVKEAIVNGLPVVSNDIGEVRSICSDVDNCFIIDKDVDAYVNCLKALVERKPRIQNRSPVINKFDDKMISEKLYDIYCNVLN